MDDSNQQKIIDTQIAERLENLIGETVIIFTTSGGASGAGFTGVVLGVNPCFVRILIKIGTTPACPLGNGCRGGNITRRGFFNIPYERNVNNDLGAIADIPVNKIVSFVHNGI